MRFFKLTTPVQLIIVVISAILFGELLPQIVQATFYSISLILKDLLLFVLPWLILCCLVLSLSMLKGRKVFIFVLTLFLVVCISNYISTLVAYGVASLRLVNINISSVNITNNKELIPLWDIKFPELISNNYALYIGFILGFLFPFLPQQITNKFKVGARKFVDIFLEKIFVPILPIFLLGFILKMQFDGILLQCIKYCLPLMLLIILTYLIYIAFLLAIVSNFNFYLWLKYIKNLIPAALTGFSTMSSIVTMPLTIDAAVKNTGDSDISRLVIPATVNIHMLGLAINIPLMALSILGT